MWVGAVSIVQAKSPKEALQRINEEQAAANESGIELSDIGEFHPDPKDAVIVVGTGDY